MEEPSKKLPMLTKPFPTLRKASRLRHQQQHQISRRLCEKARVNGDPRQRCMQPPIPPTIPSRSGGNRLPTIFNPLTPLSSGPGRHLLLLLLGLHLHRPHPLPATHEAQSLRPGRIRHRGRAGLGSHPQHRRLGPVLPTRHHASGPRVHRVGGGAR